MKTPFASVSIVDFEQVNVSWVTCKKVLLGMPIEFGITLQ